MRRRFLLIAGLASLGPGAPAAAQVTGTRFEILSVQDSTIVFPRGTAAWVGPGLFGIVVDPRRRDVVVATIRTLRVDSGMVRAMVTGTTTNVLQEHVAIIDEPRRPWYKTIMFWSGMVLGAAIGLVAGSQL